MKKFIALVLALMLLLTVASCGKTEPEVVEPTPTPAPTEPAWEEGIARAGYGEEVYELLAKDTEVKVIGKWKDYFAIEGEELNLLVETRFIRLDSEEIFAPWKGYAKYGTLVYDNVYMEGESIAALAGNKAVNVLEGKGDWLLIEWDNGEKTGYVDADMIRTYRATGGSGGSSSGGSGSSGGATSGEGGDINLDLLAYMGPEVEVLNEGGVVLANDVRSSMYLTIRDEKLKVTNVTEEECEIYMEGYTAKLPRWLVFMEGDEEYVQWTGYAKSSAVVYEEYQMRNEVQTLKRNTEVLVLDELPDYCYVVEIEGEIGYMKLDGVSRNKIVYYGGGGSSSGGSGGGSSETWTPPAM